VTTYGKGGKKETVSIKKPFNLWFDKAGHFVALPFQQILASGVKLVGEADPTKVVEGKKEKKAEESNMSMDDKWASLLAVWRRVQLPRLVARRRGERRLEVAGLYGFKCIFNAGIGGKSDGLH
jgi:signal peptidase complex subunit 2